MKTDSTQKSGRTENLRPFKKGQSGNPGGRPRTAELSKSIRAYLELSLRANSDKTRLDALIQRLYKKDPKTLLAYGFGKAVDVVTNVNITSGNAPQIEVTNASLTDLAAELARRGHTLPSCCGYQEPGKPH